MQITRNSLPTAAGPSDWFTGAVYLDPIATAKNHRVCRPRACTSLPAREPPGTTTPLGRPSMSPRASGGCQRRGGPVEVIRPGDRVHFEPGEDHWHGAAPDRFMTHIAMQEVDETGSPVTWGEHVTDEQYNAASP